jgi:hypothetical protein
MDHLPPELLSLIIGYCTPSCLKSLRLANRRCCEVATPSLFENLHLGISQESLDQFESISNSRLATYVKRCTVYLDRLPDWDHYLWEQAIYDRGISYWREFGNGPEPDPDRCTRTGQIPVSASRKILYDYFSQKQLEDAFNRFKSMRLQQIRLPTSGLDIALKECFMMFPNLDTVNCTLSITNRLQELPMPSAFWDCTQRKILVAPGDWESGEVSYCSSRAHREFAHRVSFLVFEAIAFRASFSGTKPVAKLGLHIRQHTVEGTLEYESWESIMISRALEHSYAAKMNKILNGFQHLTHIDWCIYQSLIPGIKLASFARDTAKFLRGSRSLQSLCLSLYDRGDVRTRHDETTIGDATIKELLDGGSLSPDLRYLRLRFRATCTGLLSLFRTVSRSLLSLELKDMEVGNAHELIIQIPEILRLEKIQLKSIWHVRETSEIQCLFSEGLDVNGYFENAVRDFLLRNVEQCPDLGLDSTLMQGSMVQGFS